MYVNIYIYIYIYIEREREMYRCIYVYMSAGRWGFQNRGGCTSLTRARLGRCVKLLARNISWSRQPIAGAPIIIIIICCVISTHTITCIIMTTIIFISTTRYDYHQ